MVRDNRHDTAYIFGAICPARGVGAAVITREHKDTQKLPQPALCGTAPQPATAATPDR